MKHDEGDVFKSMGVDVPNYAAIVKGVTIWSVAEPLGERYVQLVRLCVRLELALIVNIGTTFTASNSALHLTCRNLHPYSELQ